MSDSDLVVFEDKEYKIFFSYGLQGDITASGVASPMYYEFINKQLFILKKNEHELFSFRMGLVFSETNFGALSSTIDIFPDYIGKKVFHFYKMRRLFR